MTTTVAPPVVATHPTTRFQIWEEREASWRRLWSTESGVLKELYELKVKPSDIPLFVWIARTGPNLQLTGAHQRSSVGSGASIDRQIAQDAAIGEALERYCATYIMDLSEIVEARRPDLSEPSIDPACLSLFSDAQYDSPGFPYERFTESTRVAWGVMRRLRDGARVRVPVNFIFLGFHPRRGVAEIAQFISTGLACATNPAQAVLKGLYEAVERDAFNIIWLNRLSMPRLDVWQTTDPRLRELLGHFDRVRVKPSFMLLTLDIPIPIVLCVLRDDTGARPVLALGAAANLDPARAACKAAEEVAHTRQWLGTLHAAKSNKKYSADFREVVDFDDHVWLFESPEMAAHAAFLYASPTVVPLSSLASGSTGDVAGDLEVARERVERARFEVLFRDMTTPDVAEAGYCVFRTLVPGLQNINGPHASRLLGGRRLYELPVQLGLLRDPHDETELNPIPHPFP